MIIKLKAGLGNIMFQYAFGRMLQIQYGVENVSFDTSYYSFDQYKTILEHFDLMNVCYQKATKKEIDKILPLRKLYNPKPYTACFRITAGIESVFNKRYFFEKNHVLSNPQALLRYKYLDGYWQSWKYFNSIKYQLIKEFTPKNINIPSYKSLLNDILSVNSVALCIRKGDYLSTKHTRSRFYNCTPEYYEKAIEYIIKHSDNPVFYVFTNDNEWVKENITFPQNLTCIFRDEENSFSDFLELHLIASCKHAIISNSTFHWWGAWLSNNNGIVIRPKEWFADGTTIDIYPPSWINLKI